MCRQKYTISAAEYFLDYAEKKSLISQAPREGNGSDGLQETIAEFLKEKGFTVEQSVGCSGFRIDLAVKNPDRPEEFLLGIECDNKSYAAQNTTRDRETLRRQVLKGLGWQIWRAWCVDWTFDRARAEKELLNFLEQLRAGKAEEENLKKEETHSSVAAVSPIESEAEEMAVQTAGEMGSAVSQNCKEYHIWKNTCQVNQEEFYEGRGKRIIRAQIAEIIEEEAPIYETLLKRRIARAWGFSRTGGNIQRILDDCLARNFKTTHYGEERVFWSPSQTPGEYSFYRVGRTEEEKRTIDEISPEELGNGMKEILLDFNTCEKETLFRETVKLFGLSSVTAKARKYLEYGYIFLEKSGILQE